MLDKVWNAHNVSLSTKLKMFNIIVISVLFYIDVILGKA